jgi:hypothetical protein
MDEIDALFSQDVGQRCGDRRYVAYVPPPPLWDHVDGIAIAPKALRPRARAEPGEVHPVSLRVHTVEEFVKHHLSAALARPTPFDEQHAPWRPVRIAGACHIGSDTAEREHGAWRKRRGTSGSWTVVRTDRDRSKRDRTAILALIVHENPEVLREAMNRAA